MDKELIELIEEISPDSDDLLYLVINPSGTPDDRKIEIGNLLSACSHNDLSGLQGGTTDEYYHLLAAEYAELHAWLDDVTLGSNGVTSIPQLVLVPSAAAISDIEGGIFYNSSEKSVYAYTETWKKVAFADDCVLKALFDADTFLYATDDNTPVATSPANVMAALTGHAGAAFSFNAQDVSVGDLLIADAGNIGSATDPDAIAIAATGEVTLSQTLILSDVVNAGEDVDKFLVVDAAGNVDFRTGTEVLTDIGAISSGVDTANDPVANDFARFTDLNTIEGLTYAETMAVLSGEATAAFSFNGQEIQNVLLHIVADDAAKTALTSKTGMFVYQTDTGCVYVCTEGE